MTSEKFAVGTDDWFEVMEQAVREAHAQCDDRDVLDVSFSEEFTAPPTGLDRPGGLGYTVRFSGGRCEFERTPRADVDVRIRADYTAILPRVRAVIAETPPAEWSSSREALVAAGQLEHLGHGAVPSFMFLVHDVVARATR